MADKIDDVLEAIGQAIYEHNLRPETHPDVHRYLDMAKDAYVYVPWPETQEFMDEDWFEDEAILDINEASAYLIPIKRMLK